MSTQETAIVTMETVERELAALPLIQVSDLFKPETINPILDKIEAHVRSIPTDISTDKGRKDCISLAAKVCKSKTFIESSRKKHLEGIQQTVKTVNASSNAIQERLQKLQDETRQPVTDWEAAEKQRTDELEADLVEIVALGAHIATDWQTMPVAAMREALANLAEDATTDWQDYRGRAARAIADAIEKVKDAICKRETYDAEQAELAVLRKEREERAAAAERERLAKEQQERDEAIAAKARKDAESKAERERIAAELKAVEDAAKAERAARVAVEAAEREKREAIERAVQAEQRSKDAAAKAESNRIAAEKKNADDLAAAVAAERKRQDDAAEAERKAGEKRAANRKHVAKVKQEAVNALMAANVDEAIAVAVVNMIAAGGVPHVSVQF